MNNSTYQERIDEILDDFAHSVVNNPDEYRFRLKSPAAKAITSLMLDVIGEDEDPETYFSEHREWECPEPLEAEIRIRLRNELRKTLKGVGDE